ncbi:type II secretion system protein N [Xylophilus sp. GW821-FHT01B05]
MARRLPSLPTTRAPRAGWGWALAGGVLGLLAALLYFAPARWLAGTLADASDGHLLLAAPRGTVWNGSAQLVLTGGPRSADAAALPDRLQWRLRPHWNGISLQLQTPCCTPAPLALRAMARWGGARIEVADGSSQWPTALLSGLGTPWNTLQPQGALALSTHALVVEVVSGRLTLSGSAQLDAREVSSRLSPLRPMGSYRLALAGGTLPTLGLQTLEGALQLSGQGRWIGSRLRFEGEATAAAGHEAALSNLLNIIGRRMGARSIITVG